MCTTFWWLRPHTRAQGLTVGPGKTNQMLFVPLPAVFPHLLLLWPPNSPNHLNHPDPTIERRSNQHAALNGTILNAIVAGKPS